VGDDFDEQDDMMDDVGNEDVELLGVASASDEPS